MSGAAGSLRLPFGRRRRKAKAKRAKARAQKPIEYSLLLTATMCLVALGVVMVFSASSSASLLETGDGAYYLKRTLMFGAFGLLAMHVLARYGLSAIRRLTPLVLLGSIVLLFAHLRSGVLNPVTLPASAWMVLPTMAGMVIGFRVHDRLDQRRFMRLTLVVLVLSGLNLIRRAIV